MKLNKIPWILFILSTIITSCSKNPECWGETENTGIIIRSVNINCEPCIQQNNYIIQDDSTYSKIFCGPNSGIDPCDLPIIDFSSQTLLGVRAAGNCKIKIQREVNPDENEKKYVYSVRVKSCGVCKRKALNENWVLVPKLPTNWSVSFEVEED